MQLLDLGERLSKAILAAFKEEVPSSLMAAFAAGEEVEIELARSGAWPASTGNEEVTPELMKELAESFDPKEFVPRNTVGHPDLSKTETPAFGPVTGLRYDEEKDRLMAKIKPTDDLRAAVKEGRLIDRSMVFSKNWRQSGKPRLLQIGWLGATPGAITGLSPAAASFSEDAGPLETVEFRDFTQAERDAAAKSKAALPDGSFPILNKSDLHNAMQAIGRAKDPAAAKAHIRRRAKALGLTSELTPAFGGDKESASEDKGENESTESKMSHSASGSDLEKGAVMAEPNEALARSQERLVKLSAQLRDAAKDRAKGFMDANVKKIPMALVKWGLEEKLTALFAAESESENETVVSFAEDGKEVKMAVTKLFTSMLSALPEQLSTEETKETVKKPGEEKGERKHDARNNIERYEDAKTVQFADSTLHEDVLSYLSAHPEVKSYSEAFEIVSETRALKGVN